MRIYLFSHRFSDKRYHILMIWSYDFYLLLCFRMYKHETICVEKLTLDAICSFREAIFTTISVCFISEHGTSYGCHMYAYLMCTSCFYTYSEETIFFMDILLYGFIVSYRLLSFSMEYHFCLILCILSSQELRSDSIARFFGSSYDDSMICFFYFSWL